MIDPIRFISVIGYIDYQINHRSNCIFIITIIRVSVVVDFV